MLGWNVSVYRLAEGGPVPPDSGVQVSARIAVWQTGMYGLDWLTDLVQRGHAVSLGGNGYPTQFAAPARFLLPEIADGPPSADPRWMLGPDDIALDEWVGGTDVAAQLVSECDPDEWLLIRAWDQS